MMKRRPPLTLLRTDRFDVEKKTVVVSRVIVGSICVQKQSDPSIEIFISNAFHSKKHVNSTAVSQTPIWNVSQAQLVRPKHAIGCCYVYVCVCVYASILVSVCSGTCCVYMPLFCLCVVLRYNTEWGLTRHSNYIHCNSLQN